MQAVTDQGRPSSLNLEDYIVVSPSDSVEYCVQDESRPKYFPSTWGFVFPIGRAVTSWLSTVVDKNEDALLLSDSTQSSECYPLSLQRVPSSQENLVDFVGNGHFHSDSIDENGERTMSKDDDQYGSYIKRRQSLKKSNAVSSFGESDTRYLLQKFKLMSRDNSSEDYLMLKVKTKHAGSTDSLRSPLTPDTTLEKHLGEIEKDGTSSVGQDECTALPPSQLAKQSERSESLLLKRPSGGTLMKSYSEPTRTDIVSKDSFQEIALPQRPNSLTSSAVTKATNCKEQKIPSESELKSIIKKHCDKFVRFSNWDTLLPLLESEGLLDPITREKLMNNYLSHVEKGNHFYLSTLPSQGSSAYTSFYRCIVKEEEHKGHRTLQEYFQCCV